MDDVAPERHRPRAPVGILDAALLLVVVAGLAWILAPIRGAHRDADAELEALDRIGRVAAAQDVRLDAGLPAVPLGDLLDAPGWEDAFERDAGGGTGAGRYWFTVLLPDRDGVPVIPGATVATDGTRGYIVLAWPRGDGRQRLRALAALPRRARWQRVVAVGETGAADAPPLPATAFPDADGDGPAIPIAPPDWDNIRKRPRPASR